MIFVIISLSFAGKESSKKLFQRSTVFSSNKIIMLLAQKTKTIFPKSQRQCFFLFKSFHSANILRTPPRTRSQVNNVAVHASNRWGSFQRIMPASLQAINVRTMPRRPIPDRLARPYYAGDGTSSKWEPILPTISSDEIPSLRQAGQLAREILEIGAKMCLVSFVPQFQS